MIFAVTIYSIASQPTDKREQTKSTKQKRTKSINKSTAEFRHMTYIITQDEYLGGIWCSFPNPHCDLYSTDHAFKVFGELTDIQGVSKKKKPKFKFYLREDYRNVG